MQSFKFQVSSLNLNIIKMQPLVSFQPVKINNFELTIYNFDNLSLITTFLRNGPNLGAQNEDVFTAI